MKQTGEKSVWYKSVKEAGKRFVKPNGGHIVRFPFFVRHKLALTELTFTGVAPTNRTFFWNVPRKKCRSIDNWCAIDNWLMDFDAQKNFRAIFV